jgi:membrane associated rhomboid family serine protease
VDAHVPAAARGLILVFVGALAFFGFVVGSGILGGVGQALLGLVFGAAAVLYVWRRLDRPTRRRLVEQARRFVPRAPPGR